jgi:hypothetical protein
VSLKKLISHTIIIGSLLVPTPAGAVSKHIDNSVKVVNKISHAIHEQSKWYEPLLRLPSRSTIVCILEAESKSTMAHPNLKDRNPYQFGVFQFTPILWNRWSWVAGVGRKTASWYLGSLSLDAVTIPAYRATLNQQAKVFATVVRNDGYGMWTRFDGC